MPALALVSGTACQESGWKELPDRDIEVKLPEGEAVEEGGRRIVASPEAPGTRLRVKLKVAVKETAPGAQITVDQSSQLPKRSIRWIQIVKRTAPPRQNATRPNFDGVMTKGEYDANTPDPDTRRSRERRLREHNPIHAELPMFSDTPAESYTLFETYIILVVITERPGPQWKAEIGAVFKWVYEEGAQPTLDIIPATDEGFQQSLNGAKADFNGQFEFGRWYDGPPPSARQQ